MMEGQTDIVIIKYYKITTTFKKKLNVFVFCSITDRLAGQIIYILDINGHIGKNHQKNSEEIHI